jgi:hypothetical protein
LLVTSAALSGCGSEAAGQPIDVDPSAGTTGNAGGSSGGSASLGGSASTAGASTGGSGGASVGPARGGSSTGGSTTGGSATGGSGGTGGAAAGGGGTGGMAPSDGCGAGSWTCIDVDGPASYGNHTFDVPAQQNWVNTGLYLKKGQTALLSESGSWQLDGTGDGIDHGPCKVGDLVARIGLYYKDAQLTCVKGQAQFTAPRDGILFVGALAGNDLGETYETRATASGKKSVTVMSDGSTVPTVLGEAATSYDFDSVKSGWVEVWGKHVMLTLPTASAKKDAAVMARATGRLDAIYELEAELRSALPQQGQRIRFFPDGTQPGYMLAGNPVRMATTLVDGGDQTRISRSGETGTDIWGFAHEMGHDFSFAPHGFWTYEENTLESWCNVFAIYALESLNQPLNDSTADCTQSSTGSYDSWDAWGGLCFLRQFQFRYGWDFYKKYFQQIKDTESTGGGAWTFVRAQFETAAGQDVSPIFDAWGVPQ